MSGTYEIDGFEEGMEYHSGPVPFDQLPPEAPGPIRLEMKDGRVLGVECFYDGMQDGTHIWKVTNAAPINDIARAVIDFLPAKTSVVFRYTH